MQGSGLKESQKLIKAWKNQNGKQSLEIDIIIVRKCNISHAYNFNHQTAVSSKIDSTLILIEINHHSASNLAPA